LYFDNDKFEESGSIVNIVNKLKINPLK